MASDKGGTADADNPEWTADDFGNARRGREVLPPAFTRGAEQARRRRGLQKAPTKRLVSIRLDVGVLERFRSTGKGWQSRINQTLAEHAPKLRRRRRRSSPRRKSAS